jgi:hypothetical protein
MLLENLHKPSAPFQNGSTGLAFDIRQMLISACTPNLCSTFNLTSEFSLVDKLILPTPQQRPKVEGGSETTFNYFWDSPRARVHLLVSISPIQDVRALISLRSKTKLPLLLTFSARDVPPSNPHRYSRLRYSCTKRLRRARTLQRCLCNSASRCCNENFFTSGVESAILKL